MTDDERRVLTSALSSLSAIEPDLHVYNATDRNEAYNYDALGRIIMGKRLIAEMLGVPHHHMLPGEYYDDDSVPGDLNAYTPTTRSVDGQPLNTTEKRWLRLTVLPILYHIYGLSDGDDGTLRCIKRKVAEVAGYPTLSHFRLLYEDIVKPLYLKDYKAEQE